MVKKTYIFSALLILVVLTSSIYFLIPEKIRIDISETNTKYSTYDGSSYNLAATEYVYLYEGTTKMKALSRNLTWYNNSNFVYAVRTSLWKNNITTIQTYTFGINENKIENIPIKNELECLNCQGKIIQYEIRDIKYNGVTRDIVSPFSFGNNMKIEWNNGSYYSKVFQQTSSDKIVIKYKSNSNYEKYSVRLFDPILSENISLVSPTDNYVSQLKNTGLTCSVNYSLENIENLSLITNSTGPWNINSTIDIAKEHNESHLVTLAILSSGNTAWGGLGFTTNGSSGYINSLTKLTDVGCNTGYLKYGNKTTHSSVTFSGNIATFTNPILLNANTEYYVGCDKGGATYDSYHAGASYPIIAKYINWTKGYSPAVSADDTDAWNILSINLTYAKSSEINTFNTNLSLLNTTKWSCQSCDIFGACNYSSENRSLIYSPLKILYPTNNNWYNFSNLNINYTIGSTFTPSICWWTNNSGSSNNTLICPNNITTINWLNGWSTIKIYSNDSSSNLIYDSVTFNVDTIYPITEFIYPTPVNGTWTNIGNVSISVDINETNVKNITGRIYNTTGIVNETIQYFNQTRDFDFNGLSDGTFYYNVSVLDNATNINQTETRTVYIDTITPLIDYTSNSDISNSSGDLTKHNWIFTNVSITEINKQNITFTIWNISREINKTTYTTFLTNFSYINWTSLPSNTLYFYNVTICDKANNCNTTVNRFYGSEIINFSIHTYFSNVTAELGTKIEINATNTFGQVCIDILHDDYGYNYTCGSNVLNLIVRIGNFTKNIFSDNSIFKILNFNTNNNNLSIGLHQYDEIDSIYFNISGSGNPYNIFIFNLNSTMNESNFSTIDRAYDGYLVGNNIYLNRTTESVSEKNVTFVNPTNNTIYLYMDSNNKNIVNLTMNLTGFSYGLDFVEEFENITNIDLEKSTAGVGGGLALPNRTSNKEFIYDDFEDGILDQQSWINTSNSAGTNSGFDYIVSTSESSGKENLYTYIQENMPGGSGGTLTRVNYFYANLSTLELKNLNYITATKVKIEMDYYSYGRERKTSGNCNNAESSSKLVWGEAIFSSYDSSNNFCGNNGLTSSTCSETSTTLDGINITLERQLNSSWFVTINGTEISYVSKAYIGAGDCGYRYIYRYFNNGTSTTKYELCGTSTGNFSTQKYITPSSYLYFKSNSKAYYVEYEKDGCTRAYNNLYIKNVNVSYDSLSNSSLISKDVYSSASDLNKATLTASGFTPLNHSLYLFLSPDNGENWESVSSGVEHTFNNTGRNLRYRIDFNMTHPGYLNVSSYISFINLTISAGNATNISFDFGDDGINDFTYLGQLNSTNSPMSISLNQPNLTNSFTNVRKIFGNTYTIPLRISSDSIGTIELNNINLTYNPNPIYINKTHVQNYLTNYGKNETNITILINATDGTINVTDLNVVYAGGNKTIDILVHNGDNSSGVLRSITYYYSRWDYMFKPTGINYILFNPKNSSSRDVVPYGQTNSTPILNITNYGYGNKNSTLSIYVNSTLSCVNTTLSLDNNKSHGFLINESWITLTNLSYLQTTNISMWSDYNCNYSYWKKFQPYIYFKQECQGCIGSSEAP